MEDRRVISHRLWRFCQETRKGEWVDQQESGWWCLMTEDMNNDAPCKYARSRGE